MHKCIICGAPTTVVPVCCDLRCEQEWQTQVPPDDMPDHDYDAEANYYEGGY